MSKIGKKLIIIPEAVTVTISGQEVIVKGPKGELGRSLPFGFYLRKEGNVLELVPAIKKSGEGANVAENAALSRRMKHLMALWGTYRQHVANMIEGVTKGFVKVLEFEGIGYRAEASGANLILNMGFTHAVKLAIPPGLQIETTKGTITISGIDKELVGQFAAKIRKVRPPEPYKGTGIRYQGEVIRRKAGKKLAGAAG